MSTDIDNDTLPNTGTPVQTTHDMADELDSVHGRKRIAPIPTDGVDDGQTPVPGEAQYRCRLVRFTAEDLGPTDLPPDDDGYRSMQIRIRPVSQVVDGPFKGRRIRDTQKITEKSLFRLIRFCRAIGYSPQELNPLDINIINVDGGDGGQVAERFKTPTYIVKTGKNRVATLPNRVTGEPEERKFDQVDEYLIDTGEAVEEAAPSGRPRSPFSR